MQESIQSGGPKSAPQPIQTDKLLEGSSVSDNSATAVFSTAQNVLGVFPRIAAAIVGLTAIAYAFGWRESAAFYGELGAPWVIGLLNGAQIIETGVFLISVMAFVAFLSVALQIEAGTSRRALQLWAAFWMFLAAILFAVASIQPHWLSSTTVSLALAGASACWAVASGITVGELIAWLSLRSEGHESYSMKLVTFIVIWGILWAPTYLGEARAQLDAFPSALAPVTLSHSDGKDWSLVGPIGDRLLLISLADKKSDRSFKLVAPTDLAEIGSRKKAPE